MHGGSPYFVIMVLAVCVYLIRVGGFWLARHIKFNWFVESWLNHLPGCVMMSIVAPVVFTHHYIEMGACAVVIMVMSKTNNIFLAMSLGVLTVWVSQYIAGGF